MVLVAGDLPGGNYTPAGGGAVANGFQNPAAVFTEINNNALVLNKPAERTAFLAAIHKEIAIEKLTRFLARAPAVLPAGLPIRTAALAGAPANTIARNADDDYQDYINFIRADAAYAADNLTGFVGEMADAKTAVINPVAQINA